MDVGERVLDVTSAWWPVVRTAGKAQQTCDSRVHFIERVALSCSNIENAASIVP